jgi:hypothetical protein
LEFEVMDWPSQHHAILGRPMFYGSTSLHVSSTQDARTQWSHHSERKLQAL